MNERARAHVASCLPSVSFVRIAATAIAFCMPMLLTKPTYAAVAPITVADGCSYKTVSSGLGMFGNNQLTAFGHGFNFFTVTYTNNAAVAADKIVFQIDFGKASRIVIPDVGTFAPGSTTTTTFRDKGKGMIFSARPTPNDGSVICTVVSAQFADGTNYTSPLATVASPSP